MAAPGSGPTRENSSPELLGVLEFIRNFLGIMSARRTPSVAERAVWSDY